MDSYTDKERPQLFKDSIALHKLRAILEKLRDSWAIKATGIEETHGKEAPEALAFRSCTRDVAEALRGEDPSGIEDSPRGLKTIRLRRDHEPSIRKAIESGGFCHPGPED